MRVPTRACLPWAVWYAAGRRGVAIRGGLIPCRLGAGTGARKHLQEHHTYIHLKCAEVRYVFCVKAVKQLYKTSVSVSQFMLIAFSRGPRGRFPAPAGPQVWVLLPMEKGQMKETVDAKRDIVMKAAAEFKNECATDRIKWLLLPK